MPTPLVIAGMIAISCYWIFELSKKYEKSLLTFTLINVAVFLLGGAILTTIVSLILILFFDLYPFNLEMMIEGAIIVTGVLSSGIYYLILRNRWKKAKKRAIDERVIDG